jgi:hypothetical protein
MRLDPLDLPDVLNVGETAWVPLQVSTPNLFEGVLEVASSHPGLLPISASRRVWLAASGIPVRVCVELIALGASEAPVEIEIRLTAGRLTQLVALTIRVDD